jgi:hypothetical protein
MARVDAGELVVLVITAQHRRDVYLSSLLVSTPLTNDSCAARTAVTPPDVTTAR